MHGECRDRIQPLRWARPGVPELAGPGARLMLTAGTGAAPARGAMPPALVGVVCRALLARAGAPPGAAATSGAAAAAALVAEPAEAVSACACTALSAPGAGAAIGRAGPPCLSSRCGIVVLHSLRQASASDELQAELVRWQSGMHPPSAPVRPCLQRWRPACQDELRGWRTSAGLPRSARTPAPRPGRLRWTRLPSWQPEPRCWRQRLGCERQPGQLQCQGSCLQAAAAHVVRSQVLGGAGGAADGAGLTATAQQRGRHRSR